MTHLSEILDRDALAYMMAEKRIQKQVHPTLPLVIYNYTNRAQFAGEWTPEERVCRGLIATVDGEIIARGPSKFFNYGQPGAPEVSLDDKVWVSTKEDGSLGIGWYYRGHYGVATRGSFASDQAIHASAKLSQMDKIRIRREMDQYNRSMIYEIVYPENRIVLNYGGLDKLIRLGTVGNESGLIEARNLGVLYGKGSTLNYEMTFAEALALPIPDDQEGYVLDVVGDSCILGHIKLKGARYKELHGAIFGLSERKIWESMGRGDDMEDFVAALPDELMPWAQGVVDRIESEKVALFQSIGSAMAILKAMLRSKGWDITRMSDIPRGEVARLITTNHKEISGPLFSYLDNRLDAVEEWAHKQVRPEHKLFRVENEDAN